MTHGPDHLIDGWCMCGGPCCVDTSNEGRCLCRDCRCQPIGCCESEGSGCYKCRPVTAS